MSEQSFGHSNKSYAGWDQHVNVEGKGKTADSDPFSIEATLHFHNACQSTMRVKGVDEYVKKTAQSDLDAAVQEIGAGFASGAKLLVDGTTDKAVAEMERKIGNHVNPAVTDLCIISDGVEITKIKTSDH
jgi:hypothetical protein